MSSGNRELEATDFWRLLDELEHQFGNGHVVAVPWVIDRATLGMLRARHGVRGLILNEESYLELGVDAPEVGHFVPAEYQWRLPSVRSSSILFLGPRGDLSFRMIRSAMVAGFRHVVYAATPRWRRERAALFLAIRAWERLQWECARRFGPAARRVVAAVDGLCAHERVRPVRMRRMEVTFRRVVNERPELGLAVVPRRILLVNSSLAWGGAERQIVNTLVGLVGRGYRDVSLLVEHLHDRPDHDFYLWQLQRAGIPVETLPLRGQHLVRAVGDSAWLGTVTEALRGLPEPLAAEITTYAVELHRRRPEVVHAWQDSTCIKVGLAAALTGVPRIVLSARNMAPFHFEYFQSYMAPGYRALATRDNVVLLNNSNAGACDYAQWLDLPRERIKVLHNGIQADVLKRPAQREVVAYRRGLGIAPDVVVVGSIFRLYAEKDPVLWLEVVALVAAARPSVMFMLVGTGVMAENVRMRIADMGLAERVLQLGTERHVELALASMDVFLICSRIEGTPNVVIEAQWLGLPVVATVAGGTGDTLDHERSGWLVDSRDPRELARWVMALVDDRDLRERLGRHAMTFARDRFDCDRMLDETLTTYGFERHAPSIA